MPHARLVLTIPDGIWIGDLTRRYPDLSVGVLAAMPDGDAGYGLVELRTAEPGPILDDLPAFDDLRSVDVLRVTDEHALVQFETTTPLPLRAAREAGVPLETPFEICDGEIHWEVTAPHDRLSELGESLESLGIPFRVESVDSRIPDEAGLLTDRQRRLVTAAVEAGYYDTPRECSLTELADRLDLAKSTASETLHRAEEAIVKEFVASLDEAAVPEQ